MEKSKKILSAGLIFVDILMEKLEGLPIHWEQTLLAKGATLGIGGGAANSAKTFGILGEKCDILGRIGNDSFGILVEQDISKVNVGIKNIIKDNKFSTGVATGLVHKTGKRCFITARGANQEFCKEDFENIKLEDYDFLHINGYFQFPKLEENLREVMEKFKSKGIKICFDTASWDPTERWYKIVKPFVDCIDYIFLNDSQLIRLTEKNSVEESAEFLLNAGVKNVIAKLGEKGCAVFKKNKEILYVPTVKYPVCDSSGAGDSFDAAYILGLKRGWDDLKCCRFANTVAGMNCCKVGATAGVPDFDTAYNKMKEVYNL